MHLLSDKSKRFQMKTQPGDRDQVREQGTVCKDQWWDGGALSRNRGEEDTSGEDRCYCCSVPKSCPTLCDPMDCSSPDFPGED